MKPIRKTHFVSFLLVLFTAYQVSVTAFTHVHYVNGVMVVHSHPFNQKNHTHTAKTLILIAYLAAFHSPEAKASECVLFTRRPVLWVLTPGMATPLIHSYHVDYINLRAPPCC